MAAARHVLRPRLAILTNIVAPHRVPVFRILDQYFELRIFIAGHEGNRGTWDTAGASSDLCVRRSWGFTVPLVASAGQGIWDRRYVHITPGYLADLLRFRPHAIITTEMGFRTLVGLLYGTLTRTPVWVWWGGTLHTERSRRMAKRVLRLALARWAQHWISYGRSSTAYLHSLGVAPERILEIQNCVDETLFTTPVRPLVNIQPRPVLLYVGQLVGRKGVDRLLRVAGELQRDGLTFSLLVVGGGPGLERLKAYVDKLMLKNVYFLGPQPYEIMPAVYQSADCLVFPTLEDVWGLVVNEALWCGIPVACSIYAGCAEELVPKSNQFNPLDDADFARVLRMAVTGQLAPPDTSRLMRCATVAEMIREDIQKVLAKKMR